MNQEMKQFNRFMFKLGLLFGLITIGVEFGGIIIIDMFDCKNNSEKYLDYAEHLNKNIYFNEKITSEEACQLSYGMYTSPFMVVIPVALWVIFLPMFYIFYKPTLLLTENDCGCGHNKTEHFNGRCRGSYDCSCFKVYTKSSQNNGNVGNK